MRESETFSANFRAFSDISNNENLFLVRVRFQIYISVVVNDIPSGEIIILFEEDQLTMAIVDLIGREQLVEC